MEIQKKKITELKPAPYNPRKSNKKQEDNLRKSLEKFGVVEPIIFNKRTGYIVGGHFRTRELKKLGVEEVDCVIVDLSEEDERELNIRLNANTGDWDNDLLLANFEIDELADWGLEVDFGDGVNQLETKEDDFDEEPPEEPKTVLGDLYEIGEHRLLCGDSTIIDDYHKLMKDELFDLVVTDPPYNVNYEGRTKNKLTIMNDSMANSDFYNFLLKFYTSIYSFTKPGGAWYIWHADSEGHNFRSAMNEAGVKVRQCLIWVKNSMVMGRQDYQWKHEPCLYGWKDGASHNWHSDRKQTTVLEFNKPLRNSEHPTMKPIDLISYQIKNSSKERQIVGDAFLGSGSTMVASHQLNRKCYGLELDPKYCDVIVRRMLKLDPNLNIKRNGKYCKNEFID